MVDIIDEIEYIENSFKQSAPDYSYRFSMAPWTNGDQNAVERVRPASEDPGAPADEEASP
jgi:hypothetical protein